VQLLWKKSLAVLQTERERESYHIGISLLRLLGQDLLKIILRWLCLLIMLLRKGDLSSHLQRAAFSVTSRGLFLSTSREERKRNRVF
jgi:hypothetical protein